MPRTLLGSFLPLYTIYESLMNYPEGTWAERPLDLPLSEKHVTHTFEHARAQDCDQLDAKGYLSKVHMHKPGLSGGQEGPTRNLGNTQAEGKHKVETEPR